VRQGSAHYRLFPIEIDRECWKLCSFLRSKCKPDDGPTIRDLATYLSCIHFQYVCARARARVCVCVRACVRAERAGAGGKGRGEVPSTTGSLEIFGGGGSRRWCPYRQKINGIREEYGGAGWSAGLWHRWQKNRYDVFMRMARVCQADGAAIAARRISEEKHEIVVPRSRRDRTCFLSPFFASVFTIFPVLLASSSSSSSSSSSLCNKI